LLAIALIHLLVILGIIGISEDKIKYIHMEDPKFKKIIIVSLIVLFLLSVFSFGSVIFLYKKTRSGNVLPTQVVNNQNQSPNAEQPTNQTNQFAKNATGFLGLPTGEVKSETESYLKKFELKGHWIFKDKPGFDYVSKEEETKVTIIVNENTKILKMITPVDKSQKPTVKEISFNDFKIESQKNPYLVIFDQPTSSSFLAVLAKEIRILPSEVK